MISEKLYHELRLAHFYGLQVRDFADYIQITGSFDPIAPYGADTEDSDSIEHEKIFIGTPIPRVKTPAKPSPKHYRFGSGEPIGIGNPEHLCEEGMTEIFGWMICKHCGKNLRQIK